jgi:hypothetical protein
LTQQSPECCTLQDNFTEGKDDMTNQVGIDMNNDADGDDLLQYNPNRLLDTLIENLRLKNDAALSRALEVAPPVISKIRHHRLPVGASLLIRMHEVSDLSIRDLRYLMGDRRNKFRISDKQFKPKEGETPGGSNNKANPLLVSNALLPYQGRGRCLRPGKRRSTGSGRRGRRR